MGRVASRVVASSIKRRKLKLTAEDNFALAA
jgi:hypothetical protein